MSAISPRRPTASRRCSASTTRARCSTNSATRCTASSPSVTYPKIAGTNVATDFVELPSQLYEHWLEQPDVLRRFARHYQTGEPMPEELLQRLIAARNFNKGFATVEYIASRHRRSRFPFAAVARRYRTGDATLREQGARRASACRTRSSCGTGRRTSLISSPAAAMPRPITAICGRKCSTPTRSRPSKRPATFSIRRRRSGCATRSTRPAARRIRPMPTRRSAAGCRARTRCCANAASHVASGELSHHGPAQRRPSPRRRLRAAFRRRRSRPPDPRRRRQRDRSDAGDGGVDRRRLSAHEPYRRRRLLADPRAVRPRARHHGGGPGRPRRRSPSFIATTRPSRRAGRSRR